MDDVFTFKQHNVEEFQVVNQEKLLEQLHRLQHCLIYYDYCHHLSEVRGSLEMWVGLG